MNKPVLKLAIQKSGRLTEKSLQLLKNCGIDVENYKDRLSASARNFDLEIFFLRDDDIPEYVQEGVADIGIIGRNVLLESGMNVTELKKLGFSKCEIMIAGPEAHTPSEISVLNGATIATSYPNILNKYLEDNGITAKTIEIHGSVEISTALGVADYICDIVSTGNTLRMNKMKPYFKVLESEAVLIGSASIDTNPVKKELAAELLVRISSALNAKNSKYLMMNVERPKLERVLNLIPSLKSPTILPLASEDLVAVHAVIPSNKFWSIVHDLKTAGASGILLLPIENIII